MLNVYDDKQFKPKSEIMEVALKKEREKTKKEIMERIENLVNRWHDLEAVYFLEKIKEEFQIED